MRDEPPPERASRAARCVICACVASGGVHAGLVPAHLSEEPALGVSFVLAVVLLMTAAAAIAARPADERALQLAALLLAALIAGWAVSRITAVPLLVPHAEAV